MIAIKLCSTVGISFQFSGMRRTVDVRVFLFLMMYMTISHGRSSMGRRRCELKNEHRDQEQKPPRSQKRPDPEVLIRSFHDAAI